MRTILMSFLMALILTASPVLPMQSAHALKIKPAAANDAPGSFADLVEDLLPAVVNISSTQKAPEPQNFQDMPQFPEGSPFEDFFEDFMGRRGLGVPFEPPTSLGSGFIVDAEKGYIVTNNHVIRDADDIKVTLHDDETLPAEVIGTDEKTDIALLQVKTDKKLTAVQFGDSEPLRVGDWILAIGNPFGLGGTVTAGIVSARQRDINSGPYDDYIQTDASINRGNSGGPMFNLKGEVIGINTAIFSPSGGSVGIGFAIPSDLAAPVIKQIIEFGRTRRGWLGVRIQSVTDEIAESLGLEKATGALVASVTKDGPADKAGLKTGDIILSFNGHDVDEMRDLPKLVATAPIETEANIVYWRDNQKHKSAVNVGELEKAEEDGLIEGGTGDAPQITGTKIDGTGISAKAIDGAARETYGIGDDVAGIVITEVQPASEAGRKGLAEGDVIVEINQKAVQQPEEAASIIEQARAGKRNSVLLLINRAGDVRFVALKVDQADDKKDNSDQE